MPCLGVACADWPILIVTVVVGLGLGYVLALRAGNTANREEFPHLEGALEGNPYESNAFVLRRELEAWLKEAQDWERRQRAENTEEAGASREMGQMARRIAELHSKFDEEVKSARARIRETEGRTR